MSHLIKLPSAKWRGKGCLNSSRCGQAFLSSRMTSPSHSSSQTMQETPYTCRAFSKRSWEYWTISCGWIPWFLVWCEHLLEHETIWMPVIWEVSELTELTVLSLRHRIPRKSDAKGCASGPTAELSVTCSAPAPRAYWMTHSLVLRACLSWGHLRGEQPARTFKLSRREGFDSDWVLGFPGRH